MMKRIVFTVTNDLSYDQRMIRICTSLANSGYQVLLVGRRMPRSVPLQQRPFSQKRITCIFHKGFAFYAEYNLRLFFFLLFCRTSAICAIDLDTIIPCRLVAVIRKLPAIYDAHELFCEMKEIVLRPRIYRIWKWIERTNVPAFKFAYTVNQPIADEFRRMYGKTFGVIRNLPVLSPLAIPAKSERFIVYQGAVNEGRCFETLIPAMKEVNARLFICGDGNFMKQARQLAGEYGLNDRVIFKGKLEPAALRTFTESAYIGITLFDDRGLSNFYSLANRFFDYMHAGVPQLCVDFPVYRNIIEQHEFAVLVKDTSAPGLAAELNRLLSDDKLYNRLQQNCMEARNTLNWQQEEKALISFYKNVI